MSAGGVMEHGPLYPVPKRVFLETQVRPVERAIGQELSAADAQTARIPGIAFSKDNSLPLQGYRLTVGGERIEIRHRDDPGRWYAILTLRQLLERHGGESLPHGVVEDWPDFPVRGAHLDISRNRVPTMETLRLLIDALASLKVNHLELYTEHTFAYRNHPVVWRDASPITAEQMRELDAYCSRRGVELVANQNSLGHMERWLRHAEYRHLAETPDGFVDPWGVARASGSCLSPAVPECLPFLEGLYDELLSSVESCMINIGGDEPWELGTGRSAALCRQRGKGRVYLEFLQNIHRVLSGRNTRMLYYGDIITQYPELIAETPEDAVVIEWGYEANHPFEQEAKLFAGAGREFWVCAGTSSWNSTGGRWTNARQNIAAASRAGLNFGASGMLVSDWGDNGHFQQFPVALPGLLYGAAMAWGGRENGVIDVGDLLSHTMPATISHAEAALLLRLSELYLEEPLTLHNASLLGVGILPPLWPYYRNELSLLQPQSMNAVIDRAEETRQAVRTLGLDGASAGGRTGRDPTGLVSGLVSGGGRPAGSDRRTREELQFSADAMVTGAHIIREMAARTGGGDAVAPSVRIRNVLKREVTELSERFATLWRSRSRPGGLTQSAEIWKRLLAWLSE